MSAVLAGVICGLVGCVPMVWLFEQALSNEHRVSMARGLAVLVINYVGLSCVLLVVYVVAFEALLEFGCAMVAAHLTVWVIEATRGWRAANDAAVPRRGVR